jgi:citrate synthase
MAILNEFISRIFLLRDYITRETPTDMFTVVFAIGRLPGWIAQWKEILENKDL